MFSLGGNLEPYQLQKLTDLCEAKKCKVYARHGDVTSLNWPVPATSRALRSPVEGNFEPAGLEEVSVDAGGRTIRGFVMISDSWHDLSPCGKLKAEDLPHEFFNHQLLTYTKESRRDEPRDPSNRDHLVDFLETWGFPFHWARNALTGVVLGHDEGRINDEEYLNFFEGTGIAETAILETWFYGIKRLGNGSRIISEAEAVFALESLQECVLDIHESVKSGRGLPSGVRSKLTTASSNTAIPSGALNSALGGYGVGLPFVGSLTSAICNQILETLADDNPWRECACDGCNIVFKRHQSNARRPNYDSVYCCRKHLERQKGRKKDKDD